MAMTRCNECGNEISTSAKACPKCGAVVPGRKLWPWLLGVPLGLFAVVMIIGGSVPDYQHRAREIREACEKLAPMQTDECWRNYNRAVAEGKARGDK